MVKKILGLLCVLIFLIAAAGLVFAYFMGASPGINTQAVNFVIEKGQSTEEIAQNLEEKGLIKSALFFRLVSKIRGTEASFQRGVYLLDPRMNAYEIHDFLISGKQVLERVTIPEGWTSSKIAVLLEEKGISAADEFLKEVKNSENWKVYSLPDAESAEGYLFPDTYLFMRDSPADQIVKHLVKNFVSQLDLVYPTWKTLPPELLKEKVIIASIIEREYINPSEAPLMASVFYNRLAINKALESCATVVYVMTEELGLPHPQRLFFRDLRRPSAYNTYLHAGLPPGSISNPGKTSLAAAFSPAKSDYLYFVLKGPNAQQHHFSKTFSEHDQASVFYLKSQR